MHRQYYPRTIILLVLALVSLSFKEIKEGPIVCFGDSITFGANVNGHSWVWYLSNEHPNLNFINAGRSGRKTADKAELLPVLKKNSAEKYVLIFLGVNDLKDGNDSMVNNCVNNMKWMVDKIHENIPEAKIVIISPADINVKTMSPINVQKKYNQNTHQALKTLRKQYQQLAKQENIGFISLLHTVSKPNYADGLHPNDNGQMQIAHAVWKHLNKCKL